MARRIKSSRLSRYAEKQNRKQFIIFGIGTVVILFILFQFAGTILGLFGNLIFGIRGNSDDTGETLSAVEEILFPPTLNSLPNATSSATIDIEGSSGYEEGNAVLYVNNSKDDEADLKKDGTFKFNNVSLKNGNNILKVKYTIDSKESEFSEEYIVVRASEEPELEITNPADNSTYTKADKRINVTGKTEPNNSVTINSFRAVVDKNGQYSYLLELHEGENLIKVEAENEAGIKSAKEIKVTYRES